MLEELYDDVLSIMTEKGFVNWFHRNHNNKVSPLKWCYDYNGELKQTPLPPKDIMWLSNTYDSHQYFPRTVRIKNDGTVS